MNYQEYEHLVPGQVRTRHLVGFEEDVEEEEVVLENEYEKEEASNSRSAQAWEILPVSLEAKKPVRKRKVVKLPPTNLMLTSRAYTLFISENASKIKGDVKEPGSFFKEAARRWKALPDKERDVYVKKQVHAKVLS